ncbi:MAG: hypothetical protein JWO77_354 [Ilumatobacteraceae bacterium]|nr:hypothetical protein [Ilumatobacteraceae bacterium]
MARTKKVPHAQAAHVGVLRRLEHLGMSKGRHGSKTWLYVGTGLWTLRAIRRLAGRREELLISEPLRPGERLIIANNRPTLGSLSEAPEPKGRRAKKRHRKAVAEAAKVQAKRDKKATKADAKLQARVARKEAKRPKKAKPADTVVAD